MHTIRSTQITTILAALALAVAAPASSLVAQAGLAPPDIWIPEAGEIQKLQLRDGSIVYGRVEEIGETIRFTLVSGTVLEVEPAHVKKLDLARGTVREGRFQREDPNRTRLFFGPTGRGMDAGSGYFAVYELLIPFLAVAPANNVILSGGTPLVFGGGDGTRPFWFGAKARVFGNERTDVAMGVMFLAGGDVDLSGIAFGVVTHGTPDVAGTVGLGYGWSGDSRTQRPVLMLGGEARASGGVKLITENYVFPEGDILVSLGPRFFGERLTADLGLALPITAQNPMVLPLVNFVWNW